MNGEKNPTGPPFPADLDAILKANAGPAEKWNGSYSDWGLVPGVSPRYQTVTGPQVGTGKAVTVFVP